MQRQEVLQTVASIQRYNPDTSVKEGSRFLPSEDLERLMGLLLCVVSLPRIMAI